MQTDLDRLLDSISPKKTIVATFNKANEAINTFYVKSAVIKDWDDFRYSMAEFIRHIDSSVLRLRRPVDISSDYYWSVCIKVFCEIYGSNGEKAAFEMARTGNDGGLLGLLRSVAMHVAEGYAKAEIGARVDAYLKDLETAAQQLEASSEYIAKYSRFLPSEMIEASAARIHANFAKVLEKHPWLLMKIGEVGRR